MKPGDMKPGEVKPACRFRRLGLRDYRETEEAMSRFTDNRGPDTADEVWLLEHPPVFTLGTSSKLAPRRNPDGIPLVKTGRGGQITYHGPGQIVAYLLLDIRRLRLGPRRLVEQMERALIDLLRQYDISGDRRAGAPGVYVGGEKIAAIGLRIRNGCSFHGLSLNVDLDPAPFGWIDPCGIKGLGITRLLDHGVKRSPAEVGRDLEDRLRRVFGWLEE
jgi:lipoyl(octanoyl) transferase